MDTFYDEKPKNGFEKPKNDYPRERDSLLTLFLALIIGLHTVILLALCARAAQLIYFNDTGYFRGAGDIHLTTLPHVSAAFVFQGLTTACAVAVWQWQKWGYYGLIVAYVIQAILMLAAGSLLAAGVSITSLIILVLLVHSRITLFEKISDEETVRDRGGFLTLFLAFVISVNTITLVVLFELVAIRLRFGASVQGMFRLFGAEFIVPSINLVLALAVWRWKKWGLYGLTAFYVIQMFLALMRINLPAFLGSIIPLGIFVAVLLVNKRLEMFDQA